jgi:hypothetical protein
MLPRFTRQAPGTFVSVTTPVLVLGIRGHGCPIRPSAQVTRCDQPQTVVIIA